MTAADVMHALAKHARPEAVLILQRFFKTGPGQYGEGDVFIGVKVPPLRSVCKEFALLPLPEVQKLFASSIHEHRLAAAIILAYQYPKVDETSKKAIYNLYVTNVRGGRVNNWDIVDVTAENVIGRYMYEHSTPRDLLFELARSDNLWHRRAGIMSSFYFFKKGDGDFSTTLELCELLLHDKQDLIQKAVGWMLREIGKRVDTKILTGFLDHHAHDMPRTTLRYAIEHLPPAQRQMYMNLKNRQ